MGVTVVTDSAAAIPKDVADERGIRVVPIWLRVGQEPIEDGMLGLEELLARMDEGISSSAPSPGDFAKALDEAGADGALVLTLSSKFSATYDSARAAAEQADVPTRVVDTQTAAAAQALVAFAVAEAASSGATLDDVENVARRVKDEVRLVATFDDLSFLVRSGRVPEVAGWIGRKVRLNPIIEFSGGSVRPLRPAFSRDAAQDRIIAKWRNSRVENARVHVIAFHALDRDAADRLLGKVLEETDASTALVSEFGPAMVAYTGPGLVGLAWRWERSS